MRYMKVKEMARVTGVNSETIRKYRDRGLLKPHCNPENGYYEYSNVDFLNLLYIRKLRGANLSLDTIASTYTSPNADELLAGYRATVTSLQDQIEQLQKKERLLRLHLEHLEHDNPPFEGVRLVDARAAKYDSYFGGEQIDPARITWVKNMDLFIQVVCVAREYLTMETLPERVPIRLGLGTYTDILAEHPFPIPADASFFPEGRYAAFFLTVEDPESIEAAQLAPIRDFLRQHHLRPESDTTAYLHRVDNSSDTTRFIFRVRVKVADHSAARSMSQPT